MNETFKTLPNSWINSTVFEHFEEISKQFPQKIALSDGKNLLTYSEVLVLTNAIAREIHALDKIDGPVIILLENNAFFICAMLACLEAGRGYIPLDAGHTHQRNQQIINHCQAKVIISETSILEDYSTNSSIKFIDFTPNFDKDSYQPFHQKPESLAYIIYTSGSTGQPKGVFQNQRNLLHDVMQYINVAEITAEDKLSLLYSPSVSGAIRDIYGALLTGATLYINNLQKNGVTSIIDFIVRNELTIYHSIPSIFRTGMVNKSQSLDTVRLIYLAGDKIFKQDFEIYKNEFSDACKLYIGIGSTENATIYRQWFIDKHTEISANIVPVGYAVEDRVMTLVNNDGKEVANGDLGEIQVRSKYCALGYWLDDELTKKHFILHEDGSRTVKTGDWGLINNEGLLEFKGRRDGQIKINGFRIEVGEIEANIKAVEGVVDAAILIRNQGETNKVVAYISLQVNVTLDEIKMKLEGKIPSQMFPSFFYQLEEIPYLNNFKTDYQSLQIIDNHNIEQEKNVGSPTQITTKENNHYIEERLLKLWCAYVSYESFKKDLTWKMGGGNSLEAVNFIVSLEHEFRIKFPSEWIHEAMKPSIIQNQIKQLLKIEDPFQKKSKDDSVHVYAFPPLKGITPQVREFIRLLGNHVPVTLIDYPRLEEWKKDDISLEKIAGAIDKRIFEKGKEKIFIGNCSGEQFAFYILNQLEEIYPNSLSFFIMDAWNITNYSFNNRMKMFRKRTKFLGLWKAIKNAVNTRVKRFVDKQTIQKFAQSKILREKYPYKPMNIKAHLMISKEHAYTDDLLGWKYFLPRLTFELFPFKHSEMFMAGKGQQLVLDKLLRFIDEVKQHN
ncbi:AMP-dependent synthetase and ligase (plasmid) [Emticicia oligotrophica DSM 17448]|uniref:AMP-dependent synthetase and ligase n=1 Tax=Emticicia oligotrophica (strain DSM 17448 / CIP 109782 / MTCC 6937 / GPTSA100-15) TaxID=929562 RepID=A0ABN4ASV9_EMTOG|nr:AMP-binding protein [Emticicia oligotrophica]AFK05604.1 AMP-dependent synthetase and ligase [Emticicia oligotrophica DSM 17448]